MALTPHDMPIDRYQVVGWIKSYHRLKNPRTSLEDYIRKQVSNLGLDDEDVNTSGHEDRPDVTHVADLIIADLASYDAPGR